MSLRTLLRKFIPSRFSVSAQQLLTGRNFAVYSEFSPSSYMSVSRSVNKGYTLCVLRCGCQKVHSSVAMSTNKLQTFPSTLQGFGYAFNKDGELRKIDPATGQPGNEPFQFTVSSDTSYNQQHYEALGDLLTDYVYELLEKADVGLHKIRIPSGADDSTPSTFIFASEDALTNPNKLVILIHGSGVVRAGQWARSLIINENLKVGTQIPYIQKAKSLGYGVLVLNTNDNHRIVNGEKVFIKDSSTPPEHTDYVWRNFVSVAKAKKIALVAHSFGGICSVGLASRHLNDFKARVVAIALTDSVHGAGIKKMSPEVVSYLRKVSRNWVTSSEPLDTPIPGPDDDIKKVSAGHTKHEMTSASCIDSLFKFLENSFESNLTSEANIKSEL